MVDSALERFVELMDSGALGYLLAIVAGLVIIGFLSTVVHELGHAVVALACTESLVHVRVGRSPGIVRARVGRLVCSFDIRHATETDRAGVTRVFADLNRAERIAYSVGGPAANGALALFLAPLAWSLTGVSRYVVVAAIVFSAHQAVANLVSRASDSDGRLVRSAIRGEIPFFDGAPVLTGEIANTLGRWMALYANTRDARFSEQRAFLFGIAPLELGIDPRTSFDHASRCWNAARAGWCWREVRPAPAHVLAHLPTSVLRNCSLEGLRGLDLASAAAAKVARGLRLDADPDLNAAFLATTKLREAVAKADDNSRFAFQFGAALHDVERVMAQYGQRYW